MEALLLKVKITPRLPLRQVYLWIAVKQLTMDMWKSPSNPPHRQNLVLDHPLPIPMYGLLNLLSLSLPPSLPPSSNYMKPVRIMFKLELLVEFNLKSNFSVLFATSFTSITLILFWGHFDIIYIIYIMKKATPTLPHALEANISSFILILLKIKACFAFKKTSSCSNFSLSNLCKLPSLTPLNSLWGKHHTHSTDCIPWALQFLWCIHTL